MLGFSKMGKVRNSSFKIESVINRDMVLKWKLGQFVWTDLLPLKCISFSSTPLSFDSTVITLPRDTVHKIEKLTFAGKK